MSDSKRSETERWPQSDRRARAERRVKERRARVAAAGKQHPVPTAKERRKQERRRTAADRRDDSGWQQLPLDVTLFTGFAPAQGLLTAATSAREFAHAHYSKFKVGAALETMDGLIVTGCNIENATYGLTLCAERVALVKALSEGHTAFTRIAIVADTESPTPPCGSCRQLLWEYCGNIEVILGNLESLKGQYRLAALLPLPFDRRLL